MSRARPQRRFWRFGAERGGNVAILVALGSALLMGAGAIGIDLGTVFQARRKAQGAVDVAAMLAAANPARADTLARQSLSDNGYSTGSPIAVTAGAYAARAQVAPADRFQSGASPANAVRVALQTSARTHFARVLGLAPVVPIRVTGTAAQAQFATFSIGSGTVALNGGIANALLGALLGTRLSLSVMDYNALAGARVDAFRFLDALATSLNLQAASYNDILQSNASVGQVVSALQVAARGELNAAPVLSALGTLLGNLTGSAGAGATVPLAQIVDLGDAANLGPARGSAGPKVPLLNLITDAASVANGQRQISVDLGASLAGLLSARVTLAVGERRQSSSWVQPGTSNATIHTAQTRLLIEVTITAPLGLGTINLPIYAEVAPATATLKSVTCPWSDPSQRKVTIDAQPGLLTLAVAKVPYSAIAVGAATPDLSQPAPLINLPLIWVKALARTTVAPANPQTLTFSDSDIANQVTRTVTSTGLTTSLTGSLIQSLNLSVDGQDLVLLTLLKPLLLPVLSAVTPTLDLILDNVLKLLGVRLGYVDVTVDGTRCDQAVLVQ
ncbi:pilus assembly protein TadG-related protein [Methylobacterium sp. A49B]